MSNIDKQAQSYELLIENGNETANLLRHLANNEIDSDYFAVVSECESYGQETEAELSITEFALRAAGYVDALVEALEKAQKLATQQGNIACALFDEVTAQRNRIAELENSESQLIQERDDTEKALADMYQAATGERPKWSNAFGFADAVDAVEQRLGYLESRVITVRLPKTKTKLLKEELRAAGIHVIEGGEQ